MGQLVEREGNAIVPVVAGIVWRGGRFLAAERPSGKVMAGKWEFPGGKVRHGESLESALCREFKEELDIRPLTYQYWREKVKDYDHLSVRLHFFHILSFSGVLQPREGQAIAWLTVDQAREVPFLEADLEIIDALEGLRHDFCI